MLDCLAAHAHRLRVLIETLLHRFEHVLVFPSRDSPLGSCRTPGFERAARACRRPVAAQRLAVLLVRITIGQLLARRAELSKDRQGPPHGALQSWRVAMEQYVGLDVSLTMTAICIVDRTGKIEREGVVASDP